MILPTKDRSSSCDFVFERQNSECAEGIKFLVLAPRIFRNLRQLHKITSSMITDIFSPKCLQENKLKIKLQSGKGGAFFVIPVKGNFLIKSINTEEYYVMQTIISDYYVHFVNSSSTYIAPIYGCYALKLFDNEEIEPMYFVIMKNVLDTNLDTLPDDKLIHCFDIKGSTSGRKTLEHPEDILKTDGDRKYQNMTLKDADFFESYKSLPILPFQAKKIMQELENDALFFRRYGKK